MAHGNRGSRMNKSWLHIPAIDADMTAAGHQGGASLAFVEPATVLRMIGDYLITPTNGGVVALDAANIGVGIGIVSTDAATLGATALPDPASEADYPWLYWKVSSLYFRGVLDPTIPSGSADVVRVSFDIRSMRKIKPRESLSFGIEYVNVSGAPPLTFQSGGVRVLVAT